MMDRIASYTAAETYPVKTLRHPGTVDCEGRIRPIHPQINPTNNCNLNCPFCSCSERDRGAEIPWQEMQEMLRLYAGLGARALTITGGGEPLLYSHINETVGCADKLGMESGLVTNGTLFDRLESVPATWIRVSVSGDRALGSAFFSTLDDAVRRMPDVDWAFSYIATREPDADKLRRVLAFANDHCFTHVRVVADILDHAAVPLAKLRETVAGDPGEPLAIWQDRNSPTRGRKECRISLLKPVVSADGLLYPCCGVQYAQTTPGRDYVKEMSMGTWRNAENIFRRQAAFDGSRCNVCYYESYNSLLSVMVRTIDHRNFV